MLMSDPEYRESLRRLKPRVRQVWTPAVPCRAPRRIGQRRIGPALEAHGCGVALFRAAERPAGHEFGDALLLLVGERRGLRLHDAGRERLVDLFRRHLPQRRRRRRAVDVRVAVALRALRLEGREDTFTVGSIKF